MNNKHNSARKKGSNFKTIKPSRSPLSKRNFKILKSLRGNFKDTLTVTFNLFNGGQKVIPLNDQFFQQEQDPSKTITEGQILIKLNTIKHDYHAYEYILNKL